MTDNKQRPPEPPSAPSNGSDPEPHRQVPGGLPNPQPDFLDAQELKKAQTLTLVANIAGPVSIFIGGMLLSTVGVVCAAIAFFRLKRLQTKDSRAGMIAKQLKRSSIIALSICGIALVLNTVSFFILLPEVLEMVESGDYAGLAIDAGGGAAGSNATWG